MPFPQGGKNQQAYEAPRFWSPGVGPSSRVLASVRWRRLGLFPRYFKCRRRGSTRRALCMQRTRLTTSPVLRPCISEGACAASRQARARPERFPLTELRSAAERAGCHCPVPVPTRVAARRRLFSSASGPASCLTVFPSRAAAAARGRSCRRRRPHSPESAQGLPLARRNPPFALPPAQQPGNSVRLGSLPT